MSSRRERDKRREERLRAETTVSAEDRRARLLQMAAGAVFLVVAVVLVLIVVNASSSDGGGDTELEGVAEVNRHLEGIPQQGLVLGDPRAPVELVEFGDLQCPVCAGYAEEILPPLIEGPVAQGQVKIDFRNYTIIGPQSASAGAAALAAGEQRRGWNFLEIFYRNQGGENSGFADDAFLKAVAEAAGVQDLAKWSKDRTDLLKEVESTTAQAQDLGLTGTPSFAIKGPSTDGLEAIGTPESTEALEEAINEAS
ncbi:MAG TPA: thioredoxin domain-containing protein [Solirubrobacterales bacterium]|nr:thioredoxin domain-containing protein [Solirubrobacterales bacterium]